MPGSRATKPGDVVVASNGKSIQIDNTDAEGRLILADALHYASQHKPRAIINLATLTGTLSRKAIAWVELDDVLDELCCSCCPGCLCENCTNSFLVILLRL